MILDYDRYTTVAMENELLAKNVIDVLHGTFWGAALIFHIYIWYVVKRDDLFVKIYPKKNMHLVNHSQANSSILGSKEGLPSSD